MTARTAVVTVATSKFGPRLARLAESLRRVGLAHDLLAWTDDDYPPEWPTHAEVPFAFKPCALAEARARGYDVVLWMDASCLAVRPFDPLLAQLEEEGYLLFRNTGHKMIGAWASDTALAEFAMSRDEAMRVPEVNAAALGLDFRRPIAIDFLEQWTDAARKRTPFTGVTDFARTRTDYGAVKWNRENRVSADPRVKGHRHDQTVAGLVAHRLGMQLTKDGLKAVRATSNLKDQLIVVDRGSSVDLDASLSSRWAGCRTR